jgi:hypothetical protein
MYRHRIRSKKLALILKREILGYIEQAKKGRPYNKIVEEFHEFHNPDLVLVLSLYNI